MTIAQGEATSIALCWRIERTDGAGIGLTSHDRPVTADEILCEAAPGMMPAAITRSLGLDPSAGEIAGALSSDALDSDELALGRWDGAAVDVTAVDWSDGGEEAIRLLGGTVGVVAVDGDGFTADLRGAAARLEEPVCPATSPECRAHFGDRQCRVDLAGRILVATVVLGSDSMLTLDREVDARFLFGRLRYLGGANCGLATVVLSAGDKTVQLRDLPRASVEPGCRVELREGCDKRFETCVGRFDNAANFRGEPHLPGNDLLTRYPGA